jgi:alginate O-acetyltransferase complex protein AlgI
MVFSSLAFICIFLPAVFFLHTLLRSMRAKNALLIVASLLFYAYGEPVYVLLMIASTVANWLAGIGMGRASSPKGRRNIMIGAVVLNLAFLGVFKYASMFVGTLDTIFSISLPIPDIALPIGISFYTFQAMSYVIDVYRGDVPVQHSYPRVLLYISFFPQLIAGPIIRYHDIEEQLAHRHATLDDIALGFRRFCVGLAKKVLIANVMGAAVDSIYASDMSQVNVAVAWIAALAYLMQIYFDFSGYSDMAIGMAKMFGFTFKENFTHPYASTTIKEFWRRWHISLSTWFKEYLYIPLGGNRKGRPRTVTNKIIVFLTCGLWHGAAWTFVVWGAIHGAFLLLEEYVPLRKLPRPLGHIYTLLVVTVAFVIFRADTFSQALLTIGQMFTGFHFEYACVALALRQLTPVFVLTFIIACAAATPLSITVSNKVAQSSEATQRAMRTLSYVAALALLVVSMLALSGGGYNPFIYFRF